MLRCARPRFLKYVLLAERSAFLAIRERYYAPDDLLSRFQGFHVCLPPLDEQRAIAHILGTLDDKIELNRRMSETLEAMARALFKSWFVDFDPVRAKAEGRDPRSAHEASPTSSRTPSTSIPAWRDSGGMGGEVALGGVAEHLRTERVNASK